MVRPPKTGFHVADIFDEVKEDLRAERAQAMLRRYGAALLVVAVLVIGAVGGWQAWQWVESRRDARAASLYLAAMRDADGIPPAGDAAKRTAAAGAFLAIADHGATPDGYRTLSRLRAAGLKADGGDVPAALTLWNQVSADADADPLLRDLAGLLWVQHQIDSGDPATLRARLDPLIRGDNPWHPLAQEEAALLDLRLGQTDAARATLRNLTIDTTVPEGVRGRANGLLAEIGG